MRFDVFTLFPEVFEPYLQASILQRARQRGLVDVHLHNIRDWTSDRHHVTDDEPYGGGGGMVMKPGPVFAAIEGVLGIPPACPVILLTPQGRLFNQAVAQELASPAVTLARLRTQAAVEAARRSFEEAAEQTVELESDDTGGLESTLPGLGLICGRYEGVDERIRKHLATDEISVGDYVLSGGELAALVVIDAVTRLIPGVLGAPEGAQEDSHASGLLEYPHYTRPPEFRGWEVPDVLLSGDHARIARWRREQSLLRTYQRRPDLLQTAPLTKTDLKFLETLKTGHLTTKDTKEHKENL